MRNVKEKVSYLRGLVDGLQVNDPAQAKLNAAIIDALDSMADAIDENDEAVAELDECITELYDVLDEIEDEEFDEDDFVEIQCPHCGDTIYFDEEMLASEHEFICPSCNKEILADDDEIE